jgi:tetratricopeptide (TPR) repeat protein
MVVDADVNSCTALLESGHVPPQKLFMVYVNRSGGYIANGQYEKAIADLREAIRLKPDFALSYYNRGLAYGMQGHWEKAIAEYDKAICLEPGFAEAYGNRGSAFSQERRYEKAIPDFNEFIRLRPNSGLAYYNRGSVKLAMGDQSGKRDIERAKELGYVESK